jgi:hypothetical protein
VAERRRKQAAKVEGVTGGMKTAVVAAVVVEVLIEVAEVANRKIEERGLRHPLAVACHWIRLH